MIQRRKYDIHKRIERERASGGRTVGDREGESYVRTNNTLKVFVAGFLIVCASSNTTRCQGNDNNPSDAFRFNPVDEEEEEEDEAPALAEDLPLSSLVYSEAKVA